MKVEIVCVGKLKKEFIPLDSFYQKRVSNFTQFDIIEVKEGEKEAVENNLKTRLKKEFYKIAFSPEAKQVKDEYFFSQIFSQQARIQFFIGGDDGLTSDFIKSCDEIVSLSSLIFPHQLFRIMLLEQIYRGFSIVKGHPYHRSTA
ncbi:MAG: 23S rRNA (pseudouridine(1915)-N(3))-methyltransferase RlmH [Candidatus Muiribacteriota bacterium]|jgi:23S rRNA (pseudouridine1915-N3)-methyltransferase